MCFITEFHRTLTGIWQVEYNAENRPMRWTQGNRVVTMGFDRLGRRVFYREMVGDEQVTHTLFLYKCEAERSSQK